MILLAAHPLITVAVVVAIGLFIWWIVSPRFDFVIAVDGQQVDCRGAIPGAKVATIRHFFTSDIEVDQPVKICGQQSSDGRFRLHFRGEIDQGLRQRIRNFLVDVL